MGRRTRFSYPDMMWQNSARLVAAARATKGLTQEDLAALAGVSQSNVSVAERLGTSLPFLEPIAAAVRDAELNAHVAAMRKIDEERDLMRSEMREWQSSGIVPWRLIARKMGVDHSKVRSVINGGTDLSFLVKAHAIAWRIVNAKKLEALHA